MPLGQFCQGSLTARALPENEVHFVSLVVVCDDNAAALAHTLVWQNLLEQEDSRGQGHDLLGQYSLAGPEQQHDATPALWAVVVPLPLRLH